MSATIAPEALDDLDEIWFYIAKDSVAAAERVESRILDAIRLIGQRPLAGHHRRDLTRRNIRFWPVYSFLVIYDPEVRPVEVLRVLHAARDVAAALESRRSN